MIYQWKCMQYPVEAQRAGEELERIKDKYSGITADAVVEESKPKEAVLHKCFLWDDKKAANEFRKQQARVLIDNVAVVVINGNEIEKKEPVIIRAFTHVQNKSETGSKYIPVGDAMADDEYRNQILERALGEFVSLKNRYNNLKEYSKGFEKLYNDIDNLAGKQGKLEKVS
jgi:hypothetical protein